MGPDSLVALRRAAALEALDGERARSLQRLLRQGETASLRRRRGVALLSALSLLDAALVALRQMGAIGRLPDPPGPFDSDEVVTASEAYALGAPDAALGAVLHALALVLAGTGIDRDGRGAARPWSLLLGGVVGGAAVGPGPTTCSCSAATRGSARTA